MIVTYRQINSNLGGDIKQILTSFVSANVADLANTVTSNSTAAYTWIRGTATFTVKIDNPASLKIVESYQPNINTGAAVSGCVNVTLYGSNDNINWETIPVTLIDNNRNDWFLAGQVRRLVSSTYGNYGAPKYMYYKFNISSDREWVCIGTQRLYF